MVYYELKRAYENTHASLKYKKIFFTENEKFDYELHISNNGPKIPLTVICECLDIEGRQIFEQKFETVIEQNKSKMLLSDSFVVKKYKSDLFFIRLKVKQNDAIISSNLYVFSTLSEHYYSRCFH